jgi:hypothetical protein
MHRVLSTIDLNHDHLFEAYEVNDIRADRALATKLEACQGAVFQMSPHFSFSICLIPAKIPGERFHKFTRPHPYPLPKGEGDWKKRSLGLDGELSICAHQ